MALKLTLAGLSSNKPPSPDHEPPPETYTKIELVDGRTAWVSVPLPDKLSLVGVLRPSHFLPNATDTEKLVQSVKDLGSHLATDGGDGILGPTKFWEAKKQYLEVVLMLGDRSSPVKINFLRNTGKEKETCPWKLRLEFNPRKVGVEGFSGMVAELNAAQSFKIDLFLSEAKLTRLDVAVDVVGMSVSELLVRAKDQGKRVCYVGEDGVLESVYVHKAQGPPEQKYDKHGTPTKLTGKSLGALIVKIYDRVRERARVLKKAPFRPAPISRVEVIRKWTGQGPTMATLPDIENLLAGVWVGYVNHDPPKPASLWARYVACRRTADALQAASMLNLTVLQSLALEKALTEHGSDVVRTEEVWKRFPEGIAATGLDALVQLAKAGPSNTFKGGTYSPPQLPGP